MATIKFYTALSLSKVGHIILNAEMVVLRSLAKDLQKDAN